MNWTGAIGKLKNSNIHKTIIFSCFTPYQLITSCYYAFYLKGYSRVLIWEDTTYGMVDIESYKPFFSKVFVIPSSRNKVKKIMHYTKHAGWLSGSTRAIQYLKKNNSDTIYCFYSDINYCTQKHIHILKKGVNNKIILLEEGLGVYCDNKTFLPMKYKIPVVLAGAKICHQIGETKCIDAAIIKHPELASKLIKSNIAKIIKQDEFLRDERFLNALIKRVKTNSKLQFHQGRKKILFLGAPYREVQVERKEYISVLNSLIKVAGDGYDFVIKKHPREIADTYKDVNDAIILDDSEYKGLTAELIFKIFQFDVLINYNSAAAYNILEDSSDKTIIFIYGLFKSSHHSVQLAQNVIGIPNVYRVNNMREYKEALASVQTVPNRGVGNMGDDIKYLESL